jgi:1,4-alpha-glucan branching enzyme
MQARRRNNNRKQPMTIRGIPLERVIEGRLSDPHAVFGMHIDGDGLSVTTFCPGAVSLHLERDGSLFSMEMLHGQGLFQWKSAFETEFFPYRLRVTYADGNTWHTADPYSFLPQLGELDLHLFGAGKHLELHRKMGGRLWSVGEVSGTLFSVWAPNAAAVSVTGSFNNWDRRRHPMRSLGSSGVWELFVPGVSTGDYYRFVITKQDGSHQEKSDPYGTFFEKRPGNSSMVSDPFSFPWTDGAWMERRKGMNPFGRPLSIYEVHCPSWTRKRDDFNSWSELSGWLIPYVKNMGFTHVELLPVMEHPFDDSWGYQVTGFMAPTSRMGKPEDFCAFVNSCHEAGIGVILDWPPAHFPADAWALARFDGTCLYEHEDPRKGFHPDWNTLIFNYGRSEVRNFLFASAFQWLDTYHADGLRVDAVASMLYLDYSRKNGEWIPNRYGGRENIEAIEFLKELNHYVGASCPGALMIAEESTDWPGVTKPPEHGGLGFHYKWNMGWMNDTLEFFRADPVHRKHKMNMITFSAVYAWSENYILPLSHDEVVHGKGSLLGKMPGGQRERMLNLRLLLSFQWFFPGKQLLFMGGERALENEWNANVPLPEGSDEMKEFVSSLNAFAEKHPQFHQRDCDPEGFRWIDFSDTDSTIVSFLRFAENLQPMLCAFNMTPVDRGGYRLGVPVPGWWRVLFNSGFPHEYRVSAEDIPAHGFPHSIEVTLKALCCSVLSPV